LWRHIVIAGGRLPGFPVYGGVDRFESYKIGANMLITQTNEPGQNWMWAIYPFPGNYTESIRVNQLVDHKQHPAVYEAPRIEISALWLYGPVDLRSFRTALDQAELKATEWEEHTGEPA
jgi:hypothetical protein